MLIVVTYDRKFNCKWQIIKPTGEVIQTFSTLKEAKEALNEIK